MTASALEPLRHAPSSATWATRDRLTGSAPGNGNFRKTVFRRGVGKTAATAKRFQARSR